MQTHQLAQTPCQKFQAVHLGSRPVLPGNRRKCTSKRLTHAAASNDEQALSKDPEAPLRQYGKWFGKVFQLPSWIDEAPRVRVRTIARRQMDDLVELAVLNERLSGAHDPWEARNRLEMIRTRRKNWEHIYHYITKQEAAATLDMIEEANEQVGPLTFISATRSAVNASARPPVSFHAGMGPNAALMQCAFAPSYWNLILLCSNCCCKLTCSIKGATILIRCCLRH